MSYRIERRALQAAIAIGACVPVTAGSAGAFGLFTDASDLPLANHFHYLSGILLAMGLAFWSFIKDLEAKGRQVRLLSFLVLVGGIIRLGHSIAFGFFPATTLLALGMELVVTPALCAWQFRIEKLGKENGEVRKFQSSSIS